MGKPIEQDDSRPDLTSLIMKSDVRIALVGATESRGKYGSIIYRDLTEKGVRVYPVNSHRDTVHGAKAYRRLADLPERPDMVNIVTPPEVTLAILKECLALGYRNVWIQPGAADETVRSFLVQHDFNYVADACTMMSSRSRRFN